MTAVEWLYNHLFPKQLDGFSHEEWNKIDLAFKQAKEMEKEQMIKFAKMHVKTALKAVENEMILQASSVKYWYLPQNIK